MSRMGDCKSIILDIVSQSDNITTKELKLDCVLETMEVYEDLHTMEEFIEKQIIPSLCSQSRFKEYFKEKILYYKFLMR